MHTALRRLGTLAMAAGVGLAAMGAGKAVGAPDLADLSLIHI